MLQVMARTKALRRYVKDGTDEGFVEIELKGRPGKRNLTVRRSLSSKDDKSTFIINGRSGLFYALARIELIYVP